ncbi:protein FATTY ACID EXPORT 1, chloroplastic-like [Miscanthus floridulus]|uniref:protein FATTY ACID EXPORT 1, chloroplastic-like n=1 Tax=Miscanthus floridulus TaxID=154761 RepID=UPI00345A37FB
MLRTHLPPEAWRRPLPQEAGAQDQSPRISFHRNATRSRIPGGQLRCGGPEPRWLSSARTSSSDSQPWTTMCMKADYTTPVDSVATSEQTGGETEATSEQTGGETEEPAIVPPANEYTVQEAAPQQKCAKIHDFCLGIPFGGFLFSMGLVGFLFWRSPASLTFGVAPGLAILALAVLSLKVWRSGKSSLPFILAQAGIAAAVAWKHCQAYTTTRKLLPWGFYVALSAAMICFYSYVVLAGGNPPPKKAKAAA